MVKIGTMPQSVFQTLVKTFPELLSQPMGEGSVTIYPNGDVACTARVVEQLKACPAGRLFLAEVSTEHGHGK